MIYTTIRSMEKNNPKRDYGRVKQEDTPSELIKASKKGPMWIARADGKIVGTVSLDKTRVRRLFVHPQHQRRGIGRTLLTELIRYASTEKFTEIKVYALMDASSFYEKLGFQKGKTFLNPEINQPEITMRFALK